MNRSREEEEIDLWQLLQRVWQCRRLVFLSVVLFMAVGVVVAMLLPKEYKASCDMVPQTSHQSELKQMSSLASLVGVNIEGMDEQAISPYVYADIMSSVNFRKELLSTPVYVAEEAMQMTLRDYLLRDFEANDEEIIAVLMPDGVESISHADYTCFRELDNRVKLMLDDDKGLLTIEVLMPERLMAAQVAQAAMEQLQRYITRLRIEKVESNLAFVEQRYDEARSRFESVQARRARFRDSNRNTTRYAAQTELEKLDAEYALAADIYGELAMQRELAKIKVKETMPVLTIINPVAVPFRKNRPHRIIIIITFAVIGMAVGSFLALVIPSVVDTTGWRSLLNLLPAEAVQEVKNRQVRYDKL